MTRLDLAVIALSAFTIIVCAFVLDAHTCHSLFHFYNTCRGMK